ncbi:hypothetical protein MLD38_036127 [Melastoma candidum]|uniref:Uncharacterized protein n=1 Tax=Melastoma candidum TaxID=119954 RepID=A0ACB9LJX6_9MYRT|nr:hypothetical protein MLD38_036127 [Melastoma candidum]
MLAEEASTTTTSFGLPEELLAVLPSDPYDQLDLARKITSLALSSRISSLEAEAYELRERLSEKDDLIADLRSRIESLDGSLAEFAEKLSLALLEREKLLKETESLSSTIRKLNRDVSKLEVFKKTLMQSLQEDEESPTTGRAGLTQIIAKPTPSEEDAIAPPEKTSSLPRQVSETGPSPTEANETEAHQSGVSHGLLLASETAPPKLTPPGSPAIMSASGTPTRTSLPGSPRRRAMSFSITDRSSIYSSLPAGHHGSMSGETGSQAGRTRVDGKEFFRQVRNRLTYEQFGAFLANVKELNSHKQSREETLRKADEIFGAENIDLYKIFEGLITRSNVQ